ncbi:MAG: hypothetical protein GX345_07080 [Clostridiales bacterium]|nr:hypothetical protein [Clostridiales bacterium]
MENFKLQIANDAYGKKATCGCGEGGLRPRLWATKVAAYGIAAGDALNDCVLLFTAPIGALNGGPRPPFFPLLFPPKTHKIIR